MPIKHGKLHCDIETCWTKTLASITLWNHHPSLELLGKAKQDQKLWDTCVISNDLFRIKGQWHKFAVDH